MMRDGDHREHQLFWAMLIALTVVGATLLLVGFQPLAYLSSTLRLVLALTVGIVGYFEGVAVTYLARRHFRRRQAIGRARPLYVAGLTLLTVVGLVTFAYLLSIDKKNVLQFFIMGLTLGAAVGVASLIRLVMRL